MQRAQKGWPGEEAGPETTARFFCSSLRNAKISFGKSADSEVSWWRHDAPRGLGRASCLSVAPDRVRPCRYLGLLNSCIVKPWVRRTVPSPLRPFRLFAYQGKRSGPATALSFVAGASTGRWRQSSKPALPSPERSVKSGQRWSSLKHRRMQDNKNDPVPTAKSGVGLRQYGTNTSTAAAVTVVRVAFFGSETVVNCARYWRCASRSFSWFKYSSASL